MRERALEEKGLAPIPEGVTFHSLRHTYASLMAEAGVNPAYTKAQIGHVDARFTLFVYTHVGKRRGAANARLDALVGGSDWAVTCSEDASAESERFEDLQAESAQSAHWSQI